MERDQSQIHNISKRARLLAVTIFIIMIISFFFHLCAFGELFFKDVNSPTDGQSMTKFNRKIRRSIFVFRKSNGEKNR
jgi:hypothetical protein